MLHRDDFKSLIEKAIKELESGESRLSISDLPPKYSCLNGFSVPDFSEMLSSDYAMPSRDKDVEKDYFEEITLLEKLMEDAEITINLEDWQKTEIESARNMHKRLNRRAHAIQLWDWYAIPWRYRDGIIYIIWPPRDALGTPIIHSYPVDHFLTILSSVLEKQVKNQIKISKQLSFWKNIGIIAILIFGYYLLIKIVN